MFVDFHILNELGSPSINSNTFANRPPAGQIGRLFVSTDTFEIYRDNGTTWDLIGGPGSSTITGTGTANYITKFTGSQSIGNSIMTEGTGLITITGTDPRFVVGGTDDASSQLQTYSNVNTRWKFQVSSNNATDDADISGYRTRGTVAAPTAILAGDSITNYSGRGHNGTIFLGGGGMDIFAEENFTATAGGTYLILQTTSIGATTETEKIRLTANGFLGINTTTPGARLDVHSTGTIAQFNTTSATGNTYIAFQRTGTSLWRIGDTYNGGNNFFELHNTVLGVDAMEFEAATNKSTFQAQQIYTTGQARGNYFDYNLSVSAGGSFSSPNAITALGATLDLTLAGNATIPSGARSGLDAYNTVSFTGTGTLTHSQGTQIRAYSNVTAGWAFAGSATGTITHLAGMRVLFPDNSGSAVTITNNYGLLINDQTANTGTVTYTNRWGIYQEGTSDTNYFAGTTLINTTTNSGFKFDVLGGGRFFSSTAGNFTGLTLSNTSNSSSARNIFTFFNDIGSVGTIDTFSSTWSTSGGDDAANGMRILAQGSGGLSLRASTNTIRFYTGSSQRAIIDASGNLGVGITSPLYRIHVATNVDSFIIPTLIENTSSGTSAETAFRIKGGSNTFTVGIKSSTNSTNNAYIGSDQNTPTLFYTGNSYLYFQTNGLERMRLTSGGNVLFGTTTDAGYKLQVNGTLYASSNISTDGYLYAKQTGGSNAIIATNAVDADLSISVTATGAATKYASIQPSVPNLDTLINRTNGGNVGIGVTVPAAKLEVNGAIRTSAPNTGTAANWKLGSRVAATVALDTTQYIEVDIGGTLYKLAIVT